MRQSIVVVLLVCLFASCTHNSSNQLPIVGTLERDTLLGVPCIVYLPHAYAERVQESQEVFPVLYLQHGMYGSEDDWSKQGRLLHWMDSLLQEQSVKEMVIIMPDNFLGSIPPTERQSLMTAPNIKPNGEPFSTQSGEKHWCKLTYQQEKSYEMSGYWEEHFPAFMKEVENHYSVSTNPAMRAIAGLSMGGFHTMHVSHYLHGQFAYIGLFSALVATPDSGEVYIHWQDEVRETVVNASLYWIGMGEDDFLYDQIQDYRHWLEQNHLEYTYYESPGGHSWVNWQDYLCRFLKQIF